MWHLLVFFVDDGVGRVGHEVEVACRQTAFRMEKRVFCDDLVVLAVVIVRIKIQEMVL